MEQANYIKAIFTAVFAFLSALLGALAVPVIHHHYRLRHLRDRGAHRSQHLRPAGDPAGGM